MDASHPVTGKLHDAAGRLGGWNLRAHGIEVPKGEDRDLHRQTGGSEMNAIAANVVGVDLAKNVFQAYWVEIETGEIKNVQIKRAKFLEHFVLGAHRK